MKRSSATTGSVMQGYFRIERFRGAANRAEVAQPKGPVRATPQPPRPDLLPAKMRVGAVQAKAGHESGEAWTGAMPELLPGMGPARLGRPYRVAQARSGHEVSTTPIPAGQLRVIGKGRPLEAGIRQIMESFFHADFSEVRVHEGNAAQAMGALAFTLGEELHFAPGLYDLATREGVELLGHELTHVVQQRDGRVANPYGQGVAIVQDPALEAEADRMGQQIAAEMWSDVWGGPDSGAAEQRCVSVIGQHPEKAGLELRLPQSPASMVEKVAQRASACVPPSSPTRAATAPRPDLLPAKMRKAVAQARPRTPPPPALLAMQRRAGGLAGGRALRASPPGSPAGAQRSLQRMEQQRPDDRDPFEAKREGPPRIRRWDLVCRLENTQNLIEGSGNCIGIAIMFAVDMLNGGNAVQRFGWAEFARMLSRFGSRAKQDFHRNPVEYLRQYAIEFVGEMETVQLTSTDDLLTLLGTDGIPVQQALILGIQDHAIALYRSGDRYYWCDSEVGIYECRDYEAVLDVIRQHYYRDFFRGQLHLYSFMKRPG